MTERRLNAAIGTVAIVTAVVGLALLTLGSTHYHGLGIGLVDRPCLPVGRNHDQNALQGLATAPVDRLRCRSGHHVCDHPDGHGAPSGHYGH